MIIPISGLRTIEDVTPEIIEMNNHFLETMEEKEYAVFEPTDIGEEKV